MRAIKGIPDNPGSDYILVLRGLDEETFRYFEHHIKTFPTWGCLIFPEVGQHATPFAIPKIFTRIHFIFKDTKYSIFLDSEILRYVRDAFPPYDEDDPIVPRREGVPKLSEHGRLSMPPYTEEFDSLDLGRAITLAETLRASRESLRGSVDVLEHLVDAAKRTVLDKLLREPEFWDVKKRDDIDGSIDVSVSLRVVKK